MDNAVTCDELEESFDLDMLDDLVGYHLHRVEIDSYRRFMTLSGSDRITPKQFTALVLVMANRDISQADLGRIMSMDRATTTTLIDKLEANGLIARHPSAVDRRRHALRLSDAGMQSLQAMKARVNEHDKKLTSALTSQERDTLKSLLRKIRESIESA